MPGDVMERIEARHDSEGARESKLELKICERCGGLWLRPAGSRWIYCGPCKVQVDDLPAVSTRPTRSVGRKLRAGSKARAASARTERAR